MTLGRQERAGRWKERWREANRWRVQRGGREKCRPKETNRSSGGYKRRRGNGRKDDMCRNKWVR